MARIGSYPIDAVIQDKDAWIGTENTNRVTRQFTAKGIAEYIDTKNVGLVFVGATNLLPGKKGLVPAPLAGQEGMYLKGDLGGGWTTIPVYTLDVPTGTTNVNLINTDGAGAVINSFITLTGGTYLTSVHTSGSQITFNHDNTTRSDTTSTASPAAGASVPLVASVTSNATGHITAIDVKTVTWPADSDTTYTIDVPNATTSINLAGSDGTNDPIAFTTVAGNNGMTISRTDANTLNFNSKWQINNVNQDGYVPKGQANANKFWATDGNGNPGWTFQPSQDQTLTSTGTTNASTGIVLSQNGGTVIVKGDGSTISASSNNTTNVITLEAINRVNTTYTLPVAAGAANTAVINLTDNSSVVSSVTFNGTANKIAISETVGNNGDITIGMPDDVTVTGELTVSGTGQSSFGGQVTIPQTPSADTDAASKKYVDDLVSGGLTFRGTFNAATGEILSGVSSGSKLYNCPGGAGTRIAVAVGDYYIVATAGGSFYCSGATLDIGDSIIATAAANANASVVTGWSVVQSDEGVASFTNANGTFVSAGTVNSNATGAVTMGTIDLSATGTKDGTTFLRGDNTWAVPAYVSYSAMTTSTLGLGKIKYDFGSTPAAESQSTTAARTYGVTKNASDQLVVNVPWVNSSDVNSVTASGAATALSGLTSTPNTGSVVIGLDINGRASLGTPAADDELMIYDTSTAKNVKVLVSDLASYAGSAATNQVTYWTSANQIGGAAGFTFAGGANGAVTMGGALTVAGDSIFGGTVIEDPNSLARKIEIAAASPVGLILNDTRDTHPITLANEGAVLNLKYNTTSMLSLDGATSNATFAGTVETTTLRTDVINNKANSANIIYRSGTDTIIGGGSASQKLTIADSGNATFAGSVGIGGSPSHPLDVKGADTNNATIARFYSNTGTRGSFVINNGTGVSPTAFIGTAGGSEQLSIGTNSTEAIRIDGSQNATFAGKVGVGGKTPSYGITLAQGTGVNNKIAWTDSTPNFRASMWANSSDDKFKIATGNASSVETVALEIDTSQKANFTGDLQAPRIGIGAVNASFNLYNNGTTYLNGAVTVDDAFTQSGGAASTFSGTVTFNDHTFHPDQVKSIFGTGSDFQIYHDGSNSYIQNLTGWLNIPLSQNGISIANADFSESIARFLLNGAVELYYDGAKKFETVSTGVDVFGTSGNTNVRVYDGSANSEVGLKLQGDAATWTLQNWGSGGDKLRVLNNAGTSIQVWEDDGSVIFGGTDINGSFGASNTVLAVQGSTSGGEGIIQITGKGNSATDNVGKIDFHSYSETDPMCSIRSVRGNADDVGDLEFHTNSGGGAASKRMVITDLGDVGINEPTPTAKLQVNGKIKIGSGGGSGSDSGGYNVQVNSFTFGATGETGLLVRNDAQTNEYATIGFGYSENNRTPVVIGSYITDGGAATKARFVIGTRSSTTNTVYPTERLWVEPNGQVIFNPTNSSEGGIVNGFRAAISVGQSATTIGAVATYGGLAMVWMNYAGNIGYDLVSYSLSQVTVLSSQAISGGTSSRTYTSVSGVLKLTMGGSDTYSVYATEIRTANT